MAAPAGGPSARGGARWLRAAAQAARGGRNKTEISEFGPIWRGYVTNHG